MLLERALSKWGTLITLAVIGAFTFYSAPAAAYYHDGQKLYSDCMKGEQKGQDTLIPFGLCSGYITGIVDMIEILRASRDKDHCIPSRLEKGTLKDIVVKYLRDNPEKRTQSAAIVVNLAIYEAFPGCND